MKKSLMILATILSILFFATSTKAQGCPGATPTPGSDWGSPNSTAYKSGSTVYIQGLAICNMVTATPAWTSSNFIYIVPVTWRPTATRVFNATNSAGAVFQMTVYTNGNLHMQQTSGPWPGRGTIFFSGSYNL